MIRFGEKILAHVEALAGRIGVRYIGSPGNHAAAGYIRREADRLGLPTDVIESACPEWSVRGGLLEAAGSPLPLYPDPFSPPVDVSAEILPVCSPAELERAEISGKIALIYGDLTTAPVSPKAWFLITERERTILSLLESKAPAAVLSMQPAVPYFANGFCDAEFSVPAATLPRESALALLRMERPFVRLRLDTETRPGKTADLVARIPGRRAETIVLCAHYDTAAYTPGACDNAGGAAVLLALAEYFSKRPAACGLEFVWISGHEYLPLGVEPYLTNADAGGMIAAVNFDGAGHRLGTNTLCAMAASRELAAAARQKLAAHPQAVWVEPWPESDHSMFAARGVPALALGSAGVREITHTPHDTAAGMSPVKLNDAADLAAEIVKEFQGKAVEWGRE
jgi:aminopeptidase YwaD